MHIDYSNPIKCNPSIVLRFKGFCAFVYHKSIAVYGLILTFNAFYFNGVVFDWLFGQGVGVFLLF